jgi:hypothetical protein
MNKKEIKYLDPESYYITDNKLINNSYPTQDEEIKSIQRSIALLRQDIKKIVREEVEGAFQRI